MKNKQKALSIALYSIGTLALLLFLYIFRRKIITIITPFLMALVIAYLLLPVIKWFDQRKVPRRVSILLTYTTVILFSSAFIVFIAPVLVSNAKSLVNVLPQIISLYQSKINGVLDIIRASKWSGDLKGVLIVEIESGTGNIETIAMTHLKDMISSSLKTLPIAFDLVLAMIIAFYLIKDVELFKKAALSLFPDKWRCDAAETACEINQVFSDFIKGQLLTAVLVGTIESIGLMALGVRYALLLGLIGGISNLVPYFGPIIGAVPAVAIALIDSPLRALYTAIMFIAVQQIDNMFLTPRIVERKLGLHPVTTILVVLAGAEFFGFMGLFLALPFAAAIKKVWVRFFMQGRPLEN